MAGDPSETKNTTAGRERRPTPLERALTGDVYKTVFGGWRGVYELEADAAPPLSELQEAVARRVVEDRRGWRRPQGDVRLVDWCGGWTPGGRGIFEAVMAVATDTFGWRSIGRVRVVVRPSEGIVRWRAAGPRRLTRLGDPTSSGSVGVKGYGVGAPAPVSPSTGPAVAVVYCRPLVAVPVDGFARTSVQPLAELAGEPLHVAPGPLEEGAEATAVVLGRRPEFGRGRRLVTPAGVVPVDRMRS